VLLIWLFSLYLGLLPTGGSPPCLFCIDHLRHLVLPSITLAGVSVGMVARLTRSTMLEVIHEDFVRTARAKGLAERLVIHKRAPPSPPCWTSSTRTSCARRGPRDWPSGW